MALLPVMCYLAIQTSTPSDAGDTELKHGAPEEFGPLKLGSLYNSSLHNPVAACFENTCALECIYQYSYVRGRIVLGWLSLYMTDYGLRSHHYLHSAGWQVVGFFPRSPLCGPVCFQQA